MSHAHRPQVSMGEREKIAGHIDTLVDMPGINEPLFVHAAEVLRDPDYKTPELLDVLLPLRLDDVKNKVENKRIITTGDQDAALAAAMEFQQKLTELETPKHREQPHFLAEQFDRRSHKSKARAHGGRGEDWS